MNTMPVLLPAPQHISPAEGLFAARSEAAIVLVGAAPDLLPAARTIQKAAHDSARQTWRIAAASSADSSAAVTITIDAAMAKPEGYRITIGRQTIAIVAHDPAGAFYAAQTLAQLLRVCPDGVPCADIEDWPDLPARGIMLDISRDKVPTMKTLRRLVDLMASMKLNQLQLYTEHTFAYRQHAEVWAEASPMTGEEILDLDAYCHERFVELVPNQNSFGHMERWLKHPRYAPLAEAPNGCDLPWGGRIEHAFSLCPSDPGSVTLIDGLFDELLPHFTSTLFNVGCDETFDLGQGRSKAECETRTTERVYLDFLLKIHSMVRAHGRTMMFWGDIIMHQPELIPELPKDAIALEWGYEADHPFDRDGGIFHDAGVPFYVCPGTSTWNTIGGRTENAIGNLLNAAENGSKHGAIGYLITDWGDNGHHQHLPISYLGYAVGAAFSWSAQANRGIDAASALSSHVFQDRAGTMGKVAYDLGEVYKTIGKRVSNASCIVHILMAKKDDAAKLEGVTPDALRATITTIDAAIAPIDSTRMAVADADLIVREFRNAAGLLRLGCRLGLHRLGKGDDTDDALRAERDRLLGEYRDLWLARNRVGGLRESADRLERIDI